MTPIKLTFLDGLQIQLAEFFRPQVHIYTDGSQKGRWGSWAFLVVVRGRIVLERSDRVRSTTSHLMEFQAAIEALKALNHLYCQKSAFLISRRLTIRIFTDSKILAEALVGPKKRKTFNQDQVDQLRALGSQHKISWHWIKAHVGHAMNERCDQLCREAREPSP